jgi:hypothetical protein
MQIARPLSMLLFTAVLCPSARAYGQHLDRHELRRSLDQALVEYGVARHAGFLATPRYVVCAAHCMEHEADREQLTVRFHDGTTVLGRAVAVRPDLDLSVIEIPPDHGHVPLELATRGEDIVTGGTILHAGHPGGVAWSIHSGRYLGTTPVSGWTSPLLALSTAVDQGDSGGPVVCEAGRVHGVMVMGDHAVRRAFAVPAEVVTQLLGELGVAPTVPVPPVAPAPAPPAALMVTLYGAPWCRVCHQAADWLRAERIRFEERDASELPAAGRRLGRRLGGGIPVLVFIGARGTEVLEGFSATAARGAVDRVR